MDVSQLKDFIIENDKIQEILEELGCVISKNNNKEIRASVTEDNNPTALRLDKETLNYKYYGDEPIKKYGDILVLIEELKKYSFIESIDFLKRLLGLSDVELKRKEKKLPFGGLYHSIKCNTCQEIEIPTYPESILNQFDNYGSYKFLQDGISLETQIKFNIRYDIVSSRILMVWRNSEGKIAGITGRWNGEDYKELNIPKYRPIIPETDFKKSQLLYGFFENYNNMVNDVVIIGEAEKFVLQLDSMGINNGVAVGSHDIASKQIKLIQSLFPKTIILAYDKGVNEEHLIEECNRLKYKNHFTQTNIGYIWDSDNLLQDKQSPTDNGYDCLCKLINNNVKWI